MHGAVLLMQEEVGRIAWCVSNLSPGSQHQLVLQVCFSLSGTVQAPDVCITCVGRIEVSISEHISRSSCFNSAVRSGCPSFNLLLVSWSHFLAISICMLVMDFEAFRTAIASCCCCILCSTCITATRTTARMQHRLILTLN